MVARPISNYPPRTMANPFQQPAVGARLRKLRERADVSRDALATATGVTPSAIGRLERGDDVRLSTYLGLVEYFIEQRCDRELLVERLASLSDEAFEQVCGLIDWFAEHGGSDEGRG